MTRRPFRRGDRVVYTKSKRGTRPGPRAKDVRPAEHGDDYAYVVEKFWVVIGTGERWVTLLTPWGKAHRVAADDPNLRRASWWERWRFRDRSPELPEGPG